MKKTTKAFIALCVMGVIVLGCAFYFAFKPTTSNDIEGNNTQQEMPAATPSLTDEAESQPEAESQSKLEDDSAEDEIKRLTEENNKLSEENNKLSEENNKLSEENNKLKENVEKPVKVDSNGIVHVTMKYAIDSATIVFDDGTAALLATNEGTPVVLHDVHEVDQKENYFEDLIKLPVKDGKVAITFDSIEVKNATIESKGMFYSSKMDTGYELVDVKKEEWDQKLKLVIVCVPNPDAEYGYDFYVVVKDKVKTNVSKPEKEPDKEPEKESGKEPEQEPEQEPTQSTPTPKPTPENNPGRPDEDEFASAAPTPENNQTARPDEDKFSGTTDSDPYDAPPADQPAPENGAAREDACVFA